MYPTALTQLARANPFSAPLFTLQKVEEPQQQHHQQQQQSLSKQSTRKLAAAAIADGKPIIGHRRGLVDVSIAPARFIKMAVEECHTLTWMC